MTSWTSIMMNLATDPPPLNESEGRPLIIKTLTGQEYSVTYTGPDMTAEDVKKKIAEKDNKLTVNTQRLLYKGEQLRGTTKLPQEVGPGSTLVSMLRGGRSKTKRRSRKRRRRKLYRKSYKKRKTKKGRRKRRRKSRKKRRG